MNAYDFYFGEKQNAVLREHYEEIINMISTQSDKVVIQARGISFVDLPKRKENPDYLSEEEYKVLEVNSNPGIYIQRWPYEGKECRVGIEVLKLLGFID